MARQKPAFGPQLHRAWRTRIRRCLERGQWRLSARTDFRAARANRARWPLDGWL